MTDMLQTIIPKSDQLNADDLIGQELTIKITGVDIRGGQEQPISIHFEGDNGKPYKCCKSMARVMVSAWGADSKKYVGRSMTLYRDPKVKWAGMEVGGIRISHMSDIQDEMTMALTVTRSNRKPFTVRPLEAATPTASAQPTLPSAAPPPRTKAAADATITPEQESTLLDLLTAHGVELKAFLERAAIKRVIDLPASKYSGAASWIKEQRK